MGPDEVETPAQWLEHSEEWRYAHLDLAPSEHFRQAAIDEHELLLHPPERSSFVRLRWPRRPSRRFP